MAKNAKLSNSYIAS